MGGSREVINVQKLANPNFAAFLVLLGILIIFVSFANLLGWTGRAPDVIYGDEMNLPEAILLVLIGIEFYKNKRLARLFAILLAILNGAVGVLGVMSLAWSFAFAWMGLWIFVSVVSSRSSGRAQVLTSKGIG
jgi:hypothetical protein